MKKSLYFALLISTVFLGTFLAIHCGKDNPASVPLHTASALDKEITGTWRYTLGYNQDTTIHIVLAFDSGYVYKINVNINDVDTMERENGTWNIISDTISKVDTVWMARHNCHQINLQTHVLDSIDCGVDTAGIKIRIAPSGAKSVWVIPLNDFVSYLPPGIVPPGVTLPAGQFIKD
jgi:hypothetical protein